MQQNYLSDGGGKSSGSGSGWGTLLTGIGSALSGNWLSLGAAVVGNIIGGFANLRKKDEKLNLLKTSEDLSNASGNQKITEIKGNLQTIQTNIDASYGNGFYEMISKHYSTLNGNANLTADLKNSEYDFSDSDNSIYKKGNFSGERTHIASENIGDAAIDEIMNFIRSGGGISNDDINQYESEYRNIIASSLDSQNSSLMSADYSMKETNIQLEKDMLASSQNLGIAQANQSNSGIRSTGTGSNSAMLQKFQNDMMLTSYSINIQKQLASLGYDMSNMQKTASYKIASVTAQNDKYKKEALSQALATINSDFDSINSSMFDALTEYEAADEYKKQYDDLDDRSGFDIWFTGV